MAKFWNFDRAVSVVGVALVAVGSGYSVALYYRDKPASSTAQAPPNVPGVTPPWWAITLIVLGVLLLGSAWFRKKTPPASVAPVDVDDSLPLDQRRATLALRLNEATELHEQETRLRRVDIENKDARIADVVREREAALADAARQRSALRQTEDGMRDMVWTYHYCMDRPSVSALTKEDADTARLEIARLATAFEALSSSLKLVVDDMIARCQNRGSGDFGFWFCELFPRQVTYPCARALALVRKPAEIDPREAFITFFVTYRTFRQWLPRVAVALGINEAEFAGYSAWRETDARLFGEFDRIPDVPALAGIRGFIRDQMRDGFPQQLNRAATENPVLLRIASTGDDEATFLDLFCMEELPMIADQPETHLSNAVFRSGEALARDGVLTQTTIAGGKRKFCLTDTTVAVWPRTQRAARVVNQCIEIDLAAVRGTGASGGGARPR